MKLRSLICGCLTASVSLSVWSQSPAPQTGVPTAETRLLETEQSGKIRQQVAKRGAGEQSKVRIKLKDGTEVKGYISQVNADSFQVTDKKTGQTRSISYGEVAKVRGPGLSRGAKIGIAAVAVGVVMGIGISKLPND